jgi:hypothetical protein
MHHVGTERMYGEQWSMRADARCAMPATASERACSARAPLLLGSKARGATWRTRSKRFRCDRLASWIERARMARASSFVMNPLPSMSGKEGHDYMQWMESRHESLVITNDTVSM